MKAASTSAVWSLSSVLRIESYGPTLRVEEQLEELLLGLAEAERLQQHGDRLLALAVDADVDDVLLVDLELEPGTTARDHLGADDVLLGRGLVGVDTEVDARRPHELRDDDALGAVDDERAPRRSSSGSHP